MRFGVVGVVCCFLFDVDVVRVLCVYVLIVVCCCCVNCCVGVVCFAWLFVVVYGLLVVVCCWLVGVGVC